jgi:8-oxo-dGTP pyrophosphatase MutT (NUDIX family)
MFTPAILHKGRFDLAAIPVTVETEQWTPGAAYDALVDQAWAARLAKAAEHGHSIWDGRHYRVLNIADGLEAGWRLGAIPYRYIATYNSLHEEHARAKLTPLHHLTTAALVRTSDGHVLFGRRSRDNSIDLIGGGVQSDEITVTGGEDLAGNMRKEIREEMGVGAGHIRAMEGLGVLRSSTSNILIIASVDLSLSLEEARAQFPHRSDDEMSELVAVPESGLRAFLAAMSDYRVLIPALL